MLKLGSNLKLNVVTHLDFIKHRDEETEAESGEGRNKIVIEAIYKESLKDIGQGDGQKSSRNNTHKKRWQGGPMELTIFKRTSKM